MTLVYPNLALKPAVVLGSGAGSLTVPVRATAFAHSRAGPCCDYSRCRMVGWGSSILTSLSLSAPSLGRAHLVLVNSLVGLSLPRNSASWGKLPA